MSSLAVETSVEVSEEERFLFDLHGGLVLRGVLSPLECSQLLAVVERLENQRYDDSWIDKYEKRGLPTCRNGGTQIRLNGLPRLEPAFDFLIDHPHVMAYLREFVGEPRLVNTWSISKFQGAGPGGWHRGLRPPDYSVRNGEIRSRMLNVIYFLTDNGPEDGCVAGVLGSHKNHIDLDWGQHSHRNLDMPGAQAITGKAGDVFLMSEVLLHNGLPKTTPGRRTNLYFNYTHKDFNVMAYDAGSSNTHHYCLPPSVRERFTPSQREVTQWMEYAQWDA